MSYKNNSDLISSIKNHPSNEVLMLLVVLGWDPKKNGASPQGNCIVGHHSDSGTCMKVFTHSNSCFCFNCQQSFDAIKIVMILKSYDFKQALQFLAERAGISVQVTLTEEELAAFNSAERTKEILQIVTTLWNNALIDNREMMEIITIRYGLSLETIRKNKIGLCDINTPTLSYMKNQGFTDLELQRAGIILPEGKGFPREFFEGRLVFPYFQNGNIVYLIGRKTHLPTKPGYQGEDCSGKYIKLPTTNGEFKDLIDPSITGTAIYGENSIQEKDSVVVAEGVTDCLAALQLGLASVSPVTTSFSEVQKKRLFQLLKEKIVLVTGDSEPSKAGEKGAWKTAEALLEVGIEVWFGKIPELDTSHRKKIDVPEVFKYPLGKTDLNDIITTLGSEGFAAVKRASVPAYQALLLKTFPDLESAPPTTKEVIKIFSRLTNYDLDRFKEMTNWFIEKTFGTKENARSKNMRSEISKCFEIAERKKKKAEQKKLIEEERKKLIVLNSDIPRKAIVEDFSAKISTAPDLYRLGNQLTHATLEDLQTFQKSNVLTSYFAQNVSECAEISFDDTGRMEIDYLSLPEWLGTSAVESPWQHQKIREIELYSKTPAYDKTMSLSNPGYNSNSKIFYAGKGIVPNENMNLLMSFVDDWPWKDEASRTNFIGIMIAGFFKHLFPGSSPAAIVTGNQSGVGKTFIAFFCSLIYEKIICRAIPFVANEEEFQKQIVTELISGTNTILIDNIRAKQLASGTLESMITAPRLNFRLLGKNVGINRLNTIQTFFTLNDSSLSIDLLNRSIPMHLEYMGDTSKRTWKRVDFRKDVLEARDEILGALVGMIEKWKIEGQPRSAVKHRFSDCVSLLGGVLEVNGFKDFLKNADEVKTERDPMRASFCELLESLVPDRQYFAKALLEVADSNNLFHQETSFNGACSPKSRATKMAGILMRFCGENQRFPSKKSNAELFMIRQHCSSTNQQVYRVVMATNEVLPDLKIWSGEVRQQEIDLESNT